MHIHVPEGTCVCVFHVQWAMLCEEWGINNRTGEEAILSNTRSPLLLGQKAVVGALHTVGICSFALIFEQALLLEQREPHLHLLSAHSTLLVTMQITQEWQEWQGVRHFGR